MGWEHRFFVPQPDAASALSLLRELSATALGVRGGGAFEEREDVYFLVAPGVGLKLRGGVRGVGGGALELKVAVAASPGGAKRLKKRELAPGADAAAFLRETLPEPLASAAAAAVSARRRVRVAKARARADVRLPGGAPGVACLCEIAALYVRDDGGASVALGARGEAASAGDGRAWLSVCVEGGGEPAALSAAAARALAALPAALAAAAVTGDYADWLAAAIEPRLRPVVAPAGGAVDRL